MFKIVAASDTHGKVDAIDKMVDEMNRSGLEPNLILFLGDFSNYEFNKDLEKSVKEINYILDRLTSFDVHVFYVLGNRDPPYKMMEDMLNLDATYLMHYKRLRIFDNVFISAYPEHTDEHTILVGHYIEKLKENALINIEGHTHTATYCENNGRRYLSIGFLYRDGLKGAKPMYGTFFNITITQRKRIIPKCIQIGPIKEIKIHPFTFWVPQYWKRTPLHYKNNRERIRLLSFLGLSENDLATTITPI
ncbi:MAG: metallophosphoesterase family protein [Candidatus Asgardarchaeia archaeon]